MRLARTISLVILCALFAGPALAEPAMQLPGYVRLWLGKYPAMAFDQQAGTMSTHTFWDIAVVRSAVRTTLGPTRARIVLDKMNVGDKLETLAPGWVATMRCIPHDCGNAAFLYFDLVRGTLEVCWAEMSPDGRSASFWFAPGKARKTLPPNACTFDDERKTLLLYGTRH